MKDEMKIVTISLPVNLLKWVDRMKDIDRRTRSATIELCIEHEKNRVEADGKGS